MAFTGDCLQTAIICTRPRDYDVWCPRAQAYVSPRIAAYMHCVRALLDLGAHRSDVPAEDPPLVTAVNATWLNADLLALLLAAGCDPNSTGPTGLTPLMLVARNTDVTPKQRAAAARQLAEARVDVNARSHNGTTALHHAVLAQTTDMFLVLKKMGAAMNAQADSNLTPLMMAVVNRHSGCLRKLVEAGADVHFRHVQTEPYQGYFDAVGLAVTNTDVDALPVLIELGAKIDDNFVESTTHYLCEDGSRAAISEDMRRFLRDWSAFQKSTAHANEVALQLASLDDVAAARGALGVAKRGRRRRQKLERLLPETTAAAASVPSSDETRRFLDVPSPEPPHRVPSIEHNRRDPDMPEDALLIAGDSDDALGAPWRETDVASPVLDAFLREQSEDRPLLPYDPMDFYMQGHSLVMAGDTDDALGAPLQESNASPPFVDVASREQSEDRPRLQNNRRDLDMPGDSPLMAGDFDDTLGAPWEETDVASPVFPPAAVAPIDDAERVWRNKPWTVMQAAGVRVLGVPPGARGRGTDIAPADHAAAIPPAAHAAHNSAPEERQCATDLLPADECVICMSARRTTAMDPCGHFCMCDGCAAACLAAGGERSCPLCRGAVEKTLRIFQ